MIWRQRIDDKANNDEVKGISLGMSPFSEKDYFYQKKNFLVCALIVFVVVVEFFFELFLVSLDD